MFFRKKKKDSYAGVVKLKPLNYPPKVIVGWAEAVGGNEKLRDYFLESDNIKELGMFCFAVRNKDEARKWLMENGYAHLMAMINGVEGNQEALHWLEVNKFQVLKHMALAGDSHNENQEDSFNWLIKNDHKEFALVAQRIKEVKDQIEDDNNDVHRISAD